MMQMEPIAKIKAALEKAILNTKEDTNAPFKQKIWKAHGLQTALDIINELFKN